MKALSLKRYNYQMKPKTNYFSFIRKTFFIASIFLSFSLNAQECDFHFPHAKYIKEDKALEEKAKNTYSEELKEFNANYSGKKLSTLKSNLETRREFFNTMLSNGDLIVDGELYDYVRTLLDKIIVNMHLEGERTLFLVRDETPNAFNMGDNSIFIHLGLIHSVEVEEELVFVIGHELGHNELNHYQSKLIDYAELVTNDSIQKRLTNIRFAPYGRVSALNELMIPWIMASRDKSRTAEIASDDYGYQCLIACGYDPRKAHAIFATFDHNENPYDTSDLNLEALLYLNETKLDFSAELKFEVGSSLGTFEEEKDTLEDLLRTHPYSEIRQDLFEKKLDASQLGAERPDDPGHYTKYKALAEREIIIDALYRERLDRAIYYSLYLQQRDSTNCFSRMVIPFCFAYLGYEKIRRRSGKHIETQSPYYDRAYNDLIFFLRELSPQKCFAIATNWGTHYKDFSVSDIANPALLIIAIQEKDYDNFNIRYVIEMSRPDYYLKQIFQSIKTENNQ